MAMITKSTSPICKDDFDRREHEAHEEHAEHERERCEHDGEENSHQVPATVASICLVITL